MWCLPVKGANTRIIRQIVGISEVFDQNGNSVSKNTNSCQICSIGYKVIFWRNMKNMGLCLCIFRDTNLKLVAIKAPVKSVSYYGGISHGLVQA